MVKRMVALSLVTWCAIAGAAGAQQGTAEIGGRVTDEQGGVLPGATLVLTNEDTGVFREVASGGDGSYFVSQLVPGRYRLAVSLDGFRSVERRGIVLAVGNTRTINIVLPLGALQETLTVTANTPLVDLTTAEVGGNITSAELTGLPAPNRNYFAMVALLPGVQFSPSADMGNDTVIASGQASQGNNVTLDGGYNTDDSLGSSVGGQTRTPLESIQEFQVLTNQFDAEFGRATGAYVNAVTKQGTNQFRGVAFGYFTNSDLAARDYFPGSPTWTSRRAPDRNGAARSVDRSCATRPTSFSASSGSSKSRTGRARFPRDRSSISRRRSSARPGIR